MTAASAPAENDRVSAKTMRLRVATIAGSCCAVGVCGGGSVMALATGNLKWVFIDAALVLLNLPFPVIMWRRIARDVAVLLPPAV